MIKPSLLIPSQLPEFIVGGEDYQTFVAFIESYYEWLEQEKGVLTESHKILEYADIDTTLDEFIDYFYNTFLPAFPKDVVADKRKLIKFSKELYENKGNRAAYKFLFRALYNNYSDVIETKEFVLKTSAGKWFLPKSIKIKSNDSRWVNSEQLWVFGENSKTLAKVERAKLVNNRVEIFLSEIERVFETGEYVKVVDRNLQDVLFDPEGLVVSSNGEVLSGKLLGTISNVLINPKYRGNYYLDGDPIVLYGGLTDETIDIGGQAEVGEVTSGAIKRVKVENGSWGYRESPNTFIYVTPDSGKPILTVGAVNPANICNVTMMVMDSLELKENMPLNCNAETGFVHIVNTPITYFYANGNGSISITPSDYPDYLFPNTSSQNIIANANTIMSEAFTFTEFPTYSIDTVIVQNGGGGFRAIPTISAESMYETNLPFGQGDSYDTRYKPVGNTVTSIKNFGILGPILFRKDVSGNYKKGKGFELNDEIVFTGGLGGGAFAKVTEVIDAGDGPSTINTISYYINTEQPAPLGGFGYRTDELPSLTIKPKYKTANTTIDSDIIIINSVDLLDNVVIGQTISGNGISTGTTITSINAPNEVVLSNVATGSFISNTYTLTGTDAEFYVNTVLGDSAQLIPITDRIGSITTLKVTNYGEDYVASPSVSIRVQDIAVSNVSLQFLPQKGDIVYQGTNSEVFTYKAYVDSINRITYDNDPYASTYILRVYNYNRIPNYELPLTLQKTKLLEANTFPISINSSYVYPEKLLPDNTRSVVGKNGILTYGDGTAKGTAKFLNGLILGQGRYIDESHQPSSFSVMQDENYNNFTYLVTVEKEIAKYRDILYKLMHPAGTKLLGQTIIKNDIDATLDLDDSGFVNHIDEFDYIWAALATEECEENDYVSELMRFPEAINKYGLLKSNNSNILTLSDFPNVKVGQNIFGAGIVWDSKIAEIDLVNKLITMTSNATSTSNNIPLLVQDYWDAHNTRFALPYEIIYGNITTGSNLITVLSTRTDLLDGIMKNQIVVGNTTTIYANTVNSSNMLVETESVTDIIVGQYIIGNNIPNGTTVVAKYSENNSILMSDYAVASNNGFSYTYRDRVTGEQVPVYKYNYIQLQSVPYDTRIQTIITTNNSIVLSNNCTSSNNDNIFYFIGEGTNARDSEKPSEFVRVETGQFVEKYGSIGGGVSPLPTHFMFEDAIVTEDNSNTIITLSNTNNTIVSTDLAAKIYIKIR